MTIKSIQWPVITAQIYRLTNDTAVLLPIVLVFTLVVTYITVYVYLRFFTSLELRGNKRSKRVNKNKVDKDQPEKGLAFVEERGKVVRRSMRQKKKEENILITPQNQKIKQEPIEVGSGSEILTDQKFQTEQKGASTRGRGSSSKLSKSTSRLSKSSTAYQSDTN